jgi:hypothetical protein
MRFARGGRHSWINKFSAANAMNFSRVRDDDLLGTLGEEIGIQQYGLPS